MNYAHLRLFDIFETTGWIEFALDYPNAAKQVREDIERLAGKLRAIEWDTSGDGSWPDHASEAAVINYLSTARYYDAS